MSPRLKNGYFVRFLHPDLGIGGAERLTLDLAKAVKTFARDQSALSITQGNSSSPNPSNLNASGDNQIQIITNNWQADRCFPETQPFPTKFEEISRHLIQQEKAKNQTPNFAAIHQQAKILAASSNFPQNPYHPRKFFQFIPRSIFGKCFAFLAYLKMILSAIVIGLFMLPSDVIIIDQVSHCVPFFIVCNFLQSFIFGILLFPFLRRNPFKRRTKVLFYAHWPDQLLAIYSTRSGLNLKFYKLYRFFMDAFENFSMKCSDKILVNSKFTANVVANTIGVDARKLDILYPSLETEKFRKYSINEKSETGGAKKSTSRLNLSPPTENLRKIFEKIPQEQKILLSINRYEKKKNIKLAITSLKEMAKNKQPTLIIAGGYDVREEGNVTYKQELEAEMVACKLEKNVVFLTNISDAEKVFLLATADCLIYWRVGV